MTISDTADAGEWDRFVTASADASFCHLWAWRDVVADTFGHVPLYRVVRTPDGTLEGALPAFDLNTRLLGRHLVSVPFMNYGGPCGTPAARSELATWALAHGQANNLNSVLLRNRSAIAGAFPVSEGKLTVVLELPTSADEMWNRKFDAKFRNKIKRPQRDGMTTAFGHEHLREFYEIFSRNMRDLGTPVLPLPFFQRVVATFPDIVVIGATYLSGRAVAAGFGFKWRGEFEMTWSSSLKEMRASKANMLLYWDYMRHLIASGIRRFNFGRSSPGSGPHEFKRSWGGTDERLPWIHWPANRGRSSDNRAAQLASSVWRHLPLRLTNSLGPVLARELPWW